MKVFFLGMMAAPFMVLLDLIWVGLVANKYYRSQLGSLFAEHIQVVPIVLFYVMYVFALAYFAIAPAVSAHSFTKLVVSAAFLGLAAYGTYDLVNLGITTGWPLQMSIVDIAWGIIVSVAAASGSYLLATKVFGY